MKVKVLWIPNGSFLLSLHSIPVETSTTQTARYIHYGLIKILFRKPSSSLFSQLWSFSIYTYRNFVLPAISFYATSLRMPSRRFSATHPSIEDWNMDFSKCKNNNKRASPKKQNTTSAISQSSSLLFPSPINAVPPWGFVSPVLFLYLYKYVCSFSFFSFSFVTVL